MGFFDLNIPYVESLASDYKTTRVKIVIKAMELGYTGIAYNRAMKGVMSDRDRCSIPLLTLSSLLKTAPSLSSSVAFRRDLLGLPRSSPFRQYTRLTVCADSVAQCQVLNAGNPILKTYDLIAVKPLNQTAFDHACEKAEVDIISIDFAEKVPFRLKMPMVKAAIERGVCFEITYSDLIIDLQARRQMISNAKLLVDWTRGKNLILSSGAPSVNELRGPYDVANLSSLLGLSMERAKAAVSKNCRTLIANSLRKKNFYKETIKVEAISSGEKLDSEEPWSWDWLNWDPISSGEGDLQLDEMAKSFIASSKVSETVKAIDFASVISSMPAHGFQVKDLIPKNPVVSQSSNDGKRNLSAVETVQVSIATNEASDQPSERNLLPETAETSLDNAPSNRHSTGCQNTQMIDIPSLFTGTVSNTEDIGTCTTITEKELKNPDESDDFAVIETERHNYLQNCFPNCGTDVLSKEIMNCQTLSRDVVLGVAGNAGGTPPDTIDFHPSQNEESKTSKNSDADLGTETVMINKVTMEIDVKDQEDMFLALDNVAMQENLTEREHVNEPMDDQVVSDQSSLQESYNEMKVNDGSSVANHETREEVIMEEEQGREMQLMEPGDNRIVAVQIPIVESCDEMKAKDDSSSVANHETEEEVTVEELRHGEQFGEPGDVIVTDQNLLLDSYNETRTKGDSSVGNRKDQEDVKMEEKMHEEVDHETDHLAPVQCISGKIRAKPKMPRRAPLFPLKRLLSPVSFKRRAHKFKHRINKV